VTRRPLPIRVAAVIVYGLTFYFAWSWASTCLSEAEARRIFLHDLNTP
jgi:hypothetical protein